MLAMLGFHLSLGMRRGAMWKRTAVVLGYVHHDEDTSLASTFPVPRSFRYVDGFETRSMDVLSNEEGGVQKWLFDHALANPASFDVCVMRTSELQVPHFRLLPARAPYGREKSRSFFRTTPIFSKMLF